MVDSTLPRILLPLFIYLVLQLVPVVAVPHLPLTPFAFLPRIITTTPAGFPLLVGSWTLPDWVYGVIMPQFLQLFLVIPFGQAGLARCIPHYLIGWMPPSTPVACLGLMTGWFRQLPRSSLRVLDLTYALPYFLPAFLRDATSCCLIDYVLPYHLPYLYPCQLPNLTLARGPPGLPPHLPFPLCPAFPVAVTLQFLPDCYLGLTGTFCNNTTLTYPDSHYLTFRSRSFTFFIYA